MIPHLWQSTAFAILAAVLALVLRKHAARLRYGIWFGASMKFLVPFAPLVVLGGQVKWRPAPAFAPDAVLAPIKGLGRALDPAFISASAQPAAAHRIPVALIFSVVWACGFLVVIARWLIHWTRIRALARAATPIDMNIGIPVLSCAAAHSRPLGAPLCAVQKRTLEPGVFGIFRPVLLLPDGIQDRLAPAEFNAVIEHELCHVRRRDNLAAAIHMLVEAIFWFHPLVWWIGSRLMEERERACDEAVVRMGGEPRVYAESILRTCRFYLESPAVCMSGVTGADLKARIVRIMSEHAPRQMTWRHRALLAVAATIAVAAPVFIGLMNTPRAKAQEPATSFEVVSIKPGDPADRNLSRIGFMRGGRMIATNADVKSLMRLAYEVQESQITGLPAWADAARFDIEAKAPDTDHSDPMKATRRDLPALDAAMHAKLDGLLRDRFALKMHRETKEMPVYDLIVAKNGPRLRESPPNAGMPKRGMRRALGRGELSGTEVPMQMLARALSDVSGRNVLDKTGLKGVYDFKLDWTPDPPTGPEPAAAPADASGPSLFTAIQEQLGLKLEATKGPVEVLVVDHVEKPSAN